MAATDWPEDHLLRRRLHAYSLYYIMIIIQYVQSLQRLCRCRFEPVVHINTRDVNDTISGITAAIAIW